ncbi:MAG TPA: plastocyanin/azurin family copper-binding protein [Solirubrobacteraceae bacterium]|nr:plastocyanin/azurin family copper-binding protein [Solirubrobacteraceae bacterium]
MSRLSKIPVIGVLGVGLVVAGCGSNDTSSTSTPAPAATGTTSAKPTETLHIAADASGMLRFNKTTLRAKPGTIRIVMANPSQLSHGIGVDGNGVDADGPTVGPGKTSTTTATLKAGTYRFYCTINAHQAAGMVGKLIVQ